MYFSYGNGFHSNDARGVITFADQITGEKLKPADPLVQSTGFEWGIKALINEQLNTSLAVWSLELDSELLFVGDAGTTEANRPSKRWGIELNNLWSINEIWSLEADFAYEPHSKDIRCTPVTSQKSNGSKCKYLFGKYGHEVRQNMYQLQSRLALQSGVRCARIGNLALSAVFCRIKALIRMSQWVSILSFIQNAASLTTLRPAAIIATNCFRRWYLFY